MYGGYTDEHAIYAHIPGQGHMMVPHGKFGPESYEETYDVLTDCPIVEDADNGISFGFGKCEEGGKLGWADYITIHDAINTLVQVSDVNFFSSDTYVDLQSILGEKSSLCKQVLACAEEDVEDGTSCSDLEVSVATIVEKQINKPEKKDAILKRFPKLGKPGEEGSIGKEFLHRRRARRRALEEGPVGAIGSFLRKKNLL